MENKPPDDSNRILTVSWRKASRAVITKMAWKSLHGLSLRFYRRFSLLDFSLRNLQPHYLTPLTLFPLLSFLKDLLFTFTKTLLPKLHLQFTLKQLKQLYAAAVHDRMKKTETGARLISVFFLLVHSLSLSLYRRQMGSRTRTVSRNMRNFQQPDSCCCHLLRARFENDWHCLALEQWRCAFTRSAPPPLHTVGRF